MECNKDEAVRAREIAERKFSEREYIGAKRFVVKALNLYPALEGVSQFLTTLDVYIAAEHKISGEMDWYGILGVNNPFADDQVVRNQYKKLALALHPDKNKSLGAEGAFKLVSEAWTFLSDKSKRLAYNQNRNWKGFQQNAPNHFGSQSEAPSSNSLCNLNKNTTSNVRTGNNDAQVPSTSVPPHEKDATFRSVCNQCRTQFEFPRIYLNNVIVCPNCNQLFLGKEISLPPDAVKSSNWSSWQHNQNSQQRAGKNNSANPGRTCAVSQNSAFNASSGISTFDNTNLQWDLNSRMAGFDSTDGSSSFAAASFKQQECKKVKSQMYMRPDDTFNNVDKPMKKIRIHEVRNMLIEAPNHFGSQSEAPISNSLCNLNKNATSNVRTGNNDAQVPSTSVPPHEKYDTFWSVCNQCRTRFEYLRIYLNKVLECPNCKQFVAIEISPPPFAVKSSNWSSRQHNQNSRQRAGKNNPANPGRTCAVSHNSASIASSGISSFDNTNLPWDLNSRMAGFDSTDGSSSFAAASFKQHECEKVKSQMYMRPDGTFNIVDKPMKKMGKHEVRNMLIDKAQNVICKKLQEWRSMAEDKVRNVDKGNKKQKDTFDNKTTGLEKHGGFSIDDKRHLDSHSVPVTSDGGVNENQADIAMNVPDPDFHNFDMHRAEDSFEEDQVWAAYDVDGMPRYYARIHKVISIKPFRMCISWLNSRSNNELGPIDWIGSGFDKTCGDFRIGRHVMTESLNSFSHKVRWKKGNRGVVSIFPGKGEVWALYRNWSPDWNKNTPDDVIHKYDMVEVLEDFNEEEGVLVSPLVKLDGFRTVYHKQDQVRKIPKVEMFRFSHQVPNYLLTGQEAPNAPKGCQELDTAATPLDLLLQTTTEANEALNSAGNCKEDKLPTLPEKHVSGKEGDVSTPSIA